MRIGIVLLGGALLLSGCGSPPAGNAAGAEAAAGNAYTDVVEDADSRADSLDAQGEALDRAGRQIGGTEGKALRNEAAEDLSDAAAIRTGGQRAGADRADAIEERAGLANRP